MSYVNMSILYGDVLKKNFYQYYDVKIIKEFQVIGWRIKL